MNIHLTSEIRKLYAFGYAVLSNPQTRRIAVTIIVVCLALVALVIPALANGLPGGGGGIAVHLP